MDSTRSPGRRAVKDDVNRTHSRATGAVRLLLAAWLIFTPGPIQAAPRRAAPDRGQPLGVLLPLAGLSFTLGVFLLTGFMSRVAGLILVCIGAWQATSSGLGPVQIVWVVV